MADQNPQRQLYTPSASDDPYPPQQHPESSSNNTIQASSPLDRQTETIYSTSQLLRDLPVPSASAPAPRPPPSGDVSGTEQHRQIIGRRQREESDEEDGSETAAGTFTGPDQRDPKRRRRTGMWENNGDGSEPSGRNGNGNGPVANGSRGSERTLVTSTSNGASKSTAGALNGSSQNGKEPARPPQPTTYSGHDREEMTRLLMQALSEMGYQEAAASVGRDSGIELENPTVSAFRRAVLEGDWTRAEELLDGAVFAGDDTGTSSGGGLILAPNANKNKMRFVMRQQKYLELIQVRDTQRALVTLRTELTPLCQEQHTLQVLAGLLMCRDSMELMSKAKWDGLQGKSRSELLSQLSHHISPSVMLPEHRLAVLLQQVKTHQLSNCVWHTNPDPPSLYADHHCDRHAFPAETALELTAQTGEVWKVVFSHDGTKMVSCGSEDFVIIWDVPSFEVLHKLTVSGTMDSNLEDDYNGASGVGNITWSPDDSMIVTCGRDHHAKIWNVAVSIECSLPDKMSY